MPKFDERSAEKLEPMNTTEKWSGYGSLEKYVDAVSAGAITKQLMPDELGDLTQSMIDAASEAEAEQYQDALVAGFYGATCEPTVVENTTDTMPAKRVVDSVTGDSLLASKNTDEHFALSVLRGFHSARIKAAREAVKHGTDLVFGDENGVRLVDPKTWLADHIKQRTK
jgi:hypothetical protein